MNSRNDVDNHNSNNEHTNNEENKGHPNDNTKMNDSSSSDGQNDDVPMDVTTTTTTTTRDAEAMTANNQSTIYSNVLLKKKVGRLVVTSTKMTFEIPPSSNHHHLHDNELLSSSGTSGDISSTSTTTVLLVIDFCDILKHQVSPVTYPKPLLKIILQQQQNQNHAQNSIYHPNGTNQNSNITFQMMNRIDLERIRKDITYRLLQLLQQKQEERQYQQQQQQQQHDHDVNDVDNDHHRNDVHTTTDEKSKKQKKLLSSHSLSQLKHTLTSLSTTTTTTATSLKPTTFGPLDTTSIAVARSALLAANPALQKQYQYLVDESQTITSDDFWYTHQHLLEEEYARISGLAKAGTSSVLQSHLPSSGKIILGVQEIRQIFILYPAVHKAYEEKVPLELSDEQFWRKYLESEYFHKDRGRIGTVARNHQASAVVAAAAATSKSTGNDKNSSDNNNNSNSNNNAGNKNIGPSYEQQEARAAVVGTDDLFSRYDQKIQDKLNRNTNSNQMSHESNGEPFSMDGGGTGSRKRKWGRNLAVGQFDLASTFETERGKLLEGPKDNYPSNTYNPNAIITDPNEINATTIGGSRVIQKYNRHWAMVLHPDHAVAGVNLLDVARRSVLEVIPNDPDSKVHGGDDMEMRKLIQYAENDVSTANEMDDDEPLSLKNIEVYHHGGHSREHRHHDNNNDDDDTLNPDERKKKNEQLAKRHLVISQAMVMKTQALVKEFLAPLPSSSSDDTTSNTRGGGTSTTNQSPLVRTTISPTPATCFPPPALGRELLLALTKKMANDSKVEQAASLEIAKNLPDDFRNKLQIYFRRSSELLRHFFGLRQLEDDEYDSNDDDDDDDDNNDENNNGDNDNRNDDKDHKKNSRRLLQVQNQQKLARIVSGMETFYREMEVMRKELPQSSLGEIMRKMCLPIMDQLDWAFKLHREKELAQENKQYDDKKKKKNKNHRNKKSTTQNISARHYLKNEYHNNNNNIGTTPNNHIRNSNSLSGFNMPMDGTTNHAKLSTTTTNSTTKNQKDNDNNNSSSSSSNVGGGTNGSNHTNNNNKKAGNGFTSVGFVTVEE